MISVGTALTNLGPERSDLMYLNDYGTKEDRATLTETPEETYTRVHRVLREVITSGVPQAVHVI